MKSPGFDEAMAREAAEDAAHRRGPAADGEGAADEAAAE